MRFPAHGAFLTLICSAQIGLGAELMVRAVVNDSSPDGRLCPGCYGTVHYTPREFAFAANSVTVLVNGERALVNPGGESDELLSQGSFRILIPSTIVPGAANIVVTIAGSDSDPFAVTLDAYAPGLSRFDRQFVCSPAGGAKSGDVITVVATGIGRGDEQASILVGGKAVTMLTPPNSGFLTIGESRFSFRAPDEEGYRQVVLTIGGKRSNALMFPVGGAMLNVSGASFAPGPAAPGSIVTGVACGHNLGPQFSVLTGDSVNPATTLGTATVQVKDADGQVRLAPILAVSGPQVNYVIPADTAVGLATVTATAVDGSLVSADLEIGTVAPALFGVALVVRLRDGVQTVQQIGVPISAAGGDGIAGQPGSGAIDMGPATDEVYLVLFGTGIRNRSSVSGVSVDIGGEIAAVEYAGTQGVFAGLDQVNVRLPRSLAQRGDVDLRLTVDGQSANLAHLTFY